MITCHKSTLTLSHLWFRWAGSLPYWAPLGAVLPRPPASVPNWVAAAQCSSLTLGSVARLGKGQRFLWGWNGFKSETKLMVMFFSSQPKHGKS